MTESHNCCKFCKYKHTGCLDVEFRCDPEQWEKCTIQHLCIPCEHFEMEVDNERCS